MKAWYFVTEDRKLRYEDNRSIIVGETHSVDLSLSFYSLELCAYGLHASKRLIDALQYAPGTILYEVELSGKIVEGSDKVVAEHRKYIREIDATSILSEFARKQALINIEKIKPYCSIEDYNLILKWLNTSDKELRSAAWSAAWSAARSATESAARSAAESAAWSAAESAVESAARSVESAAESAAESIAESTAWSAARLTAESAAWSAARSAANTMLLEMVN